MKYSKELLTLQYYQIMMEILLTKHFGFNTNASEEDQKLIKFIELHKNKSVSEFLKTITTKFMNGQFTELSEKEALLIQKMKAEIRLKNLMADIKERELTYWHTFKNAPTTKGQTAIKTGILEGAPSCFDEKNHKIICPENCDAVFIFAEDQHDIAEAKENFIDHYYQQHGEIPKKLERELMELK